MAGRAAGVIAFPIEVEGRAVTDIASATIAPAEGKLGVLIVGLGAVATTLIAGVELAKRGIATPVGSLTQMGTIRLGKRTDGNVQLLKDYLPLAGLDDLVFGGWDVFSDNAYVAAKRAGVLEEKLLEQMREELEAIKPMPAVFEQEYVRNLHGDNIKPDASKWEWAQSLIADIENFKAYPEVLVAGEAVVFTEKIHGTWGQIGYLPPAMLHHPGHLVRRSEGAASKGPAFRACAAGDVGTLYLRVARGRAGSGRVLTVTAGKGTQCRHSYGPLTDGLLVIRYLFSEYVQGLLKMAENLRLMLSANRNFRVTPEGPPEVQHLSLIHI